MPTKVDGVLISNESLPSRIRSIALANPHNYYICLLGDAFVSDSVESSSVEKIFKEIKKEKANYCNLIPKNRNNMKDGIRKIKTKERYAVSFIAFIASYDFVVSEFINISDYDFENKYLLKSIFSNDRYLDGMFILNRNILNICHGISNGKWIRKTHKAIKNKVDFDSAGLPIQSLLDSIKEKLSFMSSVVLGPRVRYKLKKILIKLGFKFKSNY